MTGTPHERTPEATKRLARLAGAVYVSLGVATAFGYCHAQVEREPYEEAEYQSRRCYLLARADNPA